MPRTNNRQKLGATASTPRPTPAPRNTQGLKRGGRPGRPKGVPNKVTARAREAMAEFVEGNADRLQEWLDQIAETEGPLAAFRCFADVLEYHVPKLARTEVTGADRQPLIPHGGIVFRFSQQPGTDNRS